MTDATPDGFTDTPGPEATPEQEEQVRSLLAFLRDEPVPMPDDVVRRLDAVLTEERRSGSRPAGPAPAGTADGGASAAAPVTVLPTAHRPSRSTRTLRVLGGLAAAVVVVVGAVSISGALRGTGSSTAGGSALSAAAPTSDGATRITATGATYTAANLRTEATALVRDARSGPAGTASAGSPAMAETSSPGAPSPAGRPFSALSVTAAADCVRQLTQGDGSVALAVDTGTYDGQPALVVVIPTPGDRSTLDVWVVRTTCSATSADLLEFQRIPAP